MSRDDAQGWAWCVGLVVGWGGFIAALTWRAYSLFEIAGWVFGSYGMIFIICWVFSQCGNFGATPVVVVERNGCGGAGRCKDCKE